MAVAAEEDGEEDAGEGEVEVVGQTPKALGGGSPMRIGKLCQTMKKRK
jgi:hypothetical protein